VIGAWTGWPGTGRFAIPGALGPDKSAATERVEPEPGPFAFLVENSLPRETPQYGAAFDRGAGKAPAKTINSDRRRGTT
jgi:hypothetical protein